MYCVGRFVFHWILDMNASNAYFQVICFLFYRRDFCLCPLPLDLSLPVCKQIFYCMLEFNVSLILIVHLKLLCLFQLKISYWDSGLIVFHYKQMMCFEAYYVLVKRTNFNHHTCLADSLIYIIKSLIIKPNKKHFAGHINQPFSF